MFKPTAEQVSRIIYSPSRGGGLTTALGTTGMSSQRINETFAAATLLALLLLQSCTHAADENYFPIGSLSAISSDSDLFKNSWYSKYLRAMGEPVLKPNGEGRIFRFTLLRTFHHPIAVRINSLGNQTTVFAVELDGAGGYEPGRVLRKREVEISADEFSSFEKLIEKSGFWNMAAEGNESGYDGSEWIVEGVSGTRYHVISRWSPESGPVRALGEQFLSLVGWKIEANEMY